MFCGAPENVACEAKLVDFLMYRVQSLLFEKNLSMMLVMSPQIYNIN